MFQKTMDLTLIKTLTNAKIEQPNSNPSRKKHGEVCCVAKIRFVVRFSQFHFAVFGKVKDDDEDGPDVLRPDVHPCTRVRYPCHPTSQFLWRNIGVHRTPDHEGPYDRSWDERNDRIKP